MSIRTDQYLPPAFGSLCMPPHQQFKGASSPANSPYRPCIARTPLILPFIHALSIQIDFGLLSQSTLKKVRFYLSIWLLAVKSFRHLARIISQANVANDCMGD